MVRSWSSAGPQPQAMDGMTTQSDRLVIMSPTQIFAALGEDETKLPKRGDKAIEGGKTSNVEAANFIRMSNEIVRIELHVRG